MECGDEFGRGKRWVAVTVLVQKASVPDAVWAVTKIIQKETDVESDKVHSYNTANCLYISYGRKLITSNKLNVV